MTLRVRLSLAFLLVVIVPLVVAAVVVGRGVPHALDDAAQNRLAASRAGAVALVQQTCSATRVAAEVLGRSAAGGAPQQAADDVVRRGLAGYAVVADRAGRVVGRAGSLPGGAQPSAADLGSCSRGESPVAGVPAIADSVDMLSMTGVRLGAAAVAVPLDRNVVAHLAAASNAEVTLVSAGRVIGSTLSAATADGLARALPRLRTSGAPATVGNRIAAAAAVGPGQDLVIVSVRRPSVGGLELLVVGVLALAILLAAAIGWLLARLTTRPLAELSDAAARVAAGDLETRINVRSRDEVGRLASAFNDMTDELRTYIGALQSSRDELRHNLVRLGDTLSSTHDLGRILAVILDTAMGSTRASAGAVLVLQPGRDDLQLRAGRGLEGRGVPAMVRIPLGEGVTGKVAETGEAVRGHVGPGGLALSSLEPRANELISVPLRTTAGVRGVLNLYDREDGQPFDEIDLETIRTFANQAAVALDNVLLHQEAQRLSVTDGLTGLGNYRYFQATLSREIDRASRFRRPLALLMLDLDMFKTVNDAHGHQIGDAVLVEVAERVRDEIREVDVVARYGGEEFVIILPETGAEGATQLAERVCECVRRTPMHAAGLDLPLTVSVGVAVFPMHGDTPATLIRSADEALYAAKAAGRDSWRMAPEPSAVGGG